MKQSYVRVQREFLNLLLRAGIPRITRKMENWLIEKGFGTQRNQLAKLLKGESVRPLYVVKLVKYLMLNENQGAEQRDYKLVADYLKEIGKAAELGKSHHTIAEALIDHDRTDWLLDATRRFLVMDYLRDALVPETLQCKTEEIRRATGWMTLDFAKQLHPQREEITQPQADAIFAKSAGITRQDFLTAAERWHDYDAWTCVQGRVGKQQLGMCVALPLTPIAYEEFRSGQRGTCDFATSDLQRPSRHIMFQALTTNPSVRGLTPERVNKTLVGHVIHQIAMLSYADGALGCEPLHVMTFACTPQMEARLKSDGYQRLEACVLQTTMPIYERVFTQTDFFKRPHDAMLNAFVDFIGKRALYNLSPTEVREALDHPVRKN